MTERRTGEAPDRRGQKLVTEHGYSDLGIGARCYGSHQPRTDSVGPAHART